MASLNMQGPFPLHAEVIEEKVKLQGAGVFALGYLEGIDFIVLYIGRSDEDIARELAAWVGRNAKYKVFKFCYSVSPRAAFERQCKSYHDFGGATQLQNKEHPCPAEGFTWSCPFCP